MLRYMTIEKFASVSGYTPDAIRTKIRDGIWQQDKVWIKAPDNRILIDTSGYEEWVETGGALKPVRKVALKSHSCSKASAAENGSLSSPRPLI